MDVELYVYDLSRGMARAMSQQLLGIHIDAVYHTSLVFGKREYFFGAGIQTCYPGSTHHGQPMQIVPMGRTELPMDTILEYLDSLREIYTHQSYDLFDHNCNNFTNDFAMFLVGKNIPANITSLPRRVLETPFGQMLRPQIDASMRSITQAPMAPLPQSSQRAASNGSATTGMNRFGSVVHASSLDELDKLLHSAANTVSTVFFTSSTCAPCRLAYPMFDQLSTQNSNALFIKVDINAARDVAIAYQIRATPTFMTFSKGVKQDEWTGADPNMLKRNVERIIERSAEQHHHAELQLPTLSRGGVKPIIYSRISPLDKLMAKLGSAAAKPEISALQSFVANSQAAPKSAPLPDLKTIGTAFPLTVFALPVEVRFAAIDLLRCALLDLRVTGYLAEQQEPQLASQLISHVNGLPDCPHNLRLVMLHASCNFFSSPLFVKELLRARAELVAMLTQLITSSLLDTSHTTTRVAAAALAFNLARANYQMRREQAVEALEESIQIELAASLLETLSSESNVDAVKMILHALGYLVYYAPQDGALMDTCKALDAKNTVISLKEQDALTREVASLM